VLYRTLAAPGYGLPVMPIQDRLREVTNEMRTRLRILWVTLLAAATVGLWAGPASADQCDFLIHLWDGHMQNGDYAEADWVFMQGEILGCEWAYPVN
jgi:hypothetical protein